MIDRLYYLIIMYCDHDVVMTCEYSIYDAVFVVSLMMIIYQWAQSLRTRPKSHRNVAIGVHSRELIWRSFQIVEVTMADDQWETTSWER